MIDIHSHILPAVDDGAQSVEDSIAIGRQEAEGGTTVIFATPHMYNAVDIPRAPGFVELVLKLREEFEKQNVPISVLQGAEVFPMMQIIQAIEDDVPITLGGKRKHILLDLPFGQWPMILGELTFELLTEGITPILAHPERTGPVQESIDVLLPYLEKGVLCQVNAGSILGRFGPMAQRRAHQILDRQWAQFLASDVHRPSGKGPSLKAAKDLLSDLPEAYVEDITVNNPRHIVEGTSVPRPRLDIREKPAPERGGFLSGLFKKRK